MDEAKRTIAFLCPDCRQTVVVERTRFSLAAAPSHLPCPCGRSAVDVEPLGDRMELEVPCPVCRQHHRVTCDAKAFLHQRALAFTCAASGLECCFVGEEGPVYEAARRLEEKADKLEGQDRDRGTFLDEIVMHEVLSEVKDIAARGGISCTCGSRQWRLQVNYSSVDLTCAACGGTMRIPAGCADDIDDICCKTTLTIHGGDG
jgi:hypothetical protein